MSSDVNVLTPGARVIGSEPAKEIVRAFLDAGFTGEERHARRLAKVLAIEARFAPPAGSGASGYRPGERGGSLQ